MALRQDPYGNAFCPRCGSKLEKDTGFGAVLAAMVLTDIVTWILTAIFVGVGMLWTPAYIIAACIATFGIFSMMFRQQRLVCRKCGREFGLDGVEH